MIGDFKRMFGFGCSMPTDAELGKSEVTSLRVAKIAAKGIKTPEALTLKEIKAVCASVLTQRTGNEKSKQR